MLRHTLKFTAIAGLAACAIPPINPESATLSRDRLTVSFGNGINCYGSRTEATTTETGWAGVLEDCALNYDYEVTLLPGNNPVRYVLIEGAKALGGEDLFAPLAVVYITMPNGAVKEFVSPPEVTEDD